MCVCVCLMQTYRLNPRSAPQDTPALYGGFVYDASPAAAVVAPVVVVVASPSQSRERWTHPPTAPSPASPVPTTPTAPIFTSSRSLARGR